MRTTKYVAVAILVIATPADAAGWKTIVSDSADGRAAALIGTEGDDEMRGISIVCGFDSGLPAFLRVASTPSTVYGVKPGEPAFIAISGLRLAGEVIANDSRSTQAQADLMAPADLLERISQASAPILVELTADELAVEIQIPTTHIAEAIRDLEQACGL